MAHLRITNWDNIGIGVHFIRNEASYLHAPSTGGVNKGTNVKVVPNLQVSNVHGLRDIIKVTSFVVPLILNVSCECAYF